MAVKRLTSAQPQADLLSLRERQSARTGCPRNGRRANRQPDYSFWATSGEQPTSSPISLSEYPLARSRNASARCSAVRRGLPIRNLLGRS